MRNRTEKAILDFNMIQPDERILVGVSGGADSLSLLQILHEGFPHIKNTFSILAVHIDPGFGRKSGSLESHFKKLGVDYRIVHTDIARHALDPEATKNPCFICSMYRRKKIYELAHQEKCTRIAYGHHKDDIIETLLINILYGRKIEAMRPVQEVFHGNMFIIRPFTYIDEDLLKRFAREMALPVFPRLCPADGKTRRARVKLLIRQLQKEEKNANIRENIFKSHYHTNLKFP